MKILVLSDSHGYMNGMLEAIEREEPDHILHLGDTGRDAESLQQLVPHIPCAYVSGNCDGYSLMPPTRCLTLGGALIFMTHGHPYHVKRGYGGAIQAANQVNADILLFGHTHQRDVDEWQPGRWLMNPGSCGMFAPTYGIILLEEGEINCYTVAL